MVPMRFKVVGVVFAVLISGLEASRFSYQRYPYSKNCRGYCPQQQGYQPQPQTYQPQNPYPFEPVNGGSQIMPQLEETQPQPPIASPDQAGSDSQPDSTDKTKLLQLHNQYRRQVASGLVPGQPASDKIKDLQWNMELEQKAQRHSDSCEFAHDSDRHTSQWPWVGQNIAYSSSIEQNVNMWFDEYKSYSYHDNTCSGMCGHYTQLVWADTTHIGCGVSQCNMSGFNAVYVVCNYGPGGNFNGQRPY